MPHERATVKEIARLAGVSIGTVDRVLHDRGGVSPATKEKIKALVAELGYEPNLLARQLSLKKAYTLRVLLPRSDQDSGYWALCLEGLRKASRDLQPYQVGIRIDQFDRHDQTAYRALLADLAEDPGDGVLLAPVLSEGLLPLLRRLSGEEGRSGRKNPQASVPYAFFDSEIPDAKPVVVVAQDPFRSGYLSGRLMSLLSPGSSTLLAVAAYSEDTHIARRIEGFRSFFKERNEEGRVKEAQCPWLEDPLELDRHLSDFFGSKPELGGILVANASGHLIGEWLAGRGLKARVPLVSWDAVPANVMALREGRLDCLVSQRPAEQAREALVRLFRAVASEKGAKLSPVPDIPLEVYFKENVPVLPEGSGEEDSDEA